MDNKTDQVRPDQIDRWGLLQEENRQLRADLRDATEIIESVADDIAKDYPADGRVLCGFCHRKEHSKNCIVRIAKEFISRPSIIDLFKKEEAK